MLKEISLLLPSKLQICICDSDQANIFHVAMRQCNASSPTLLIGLGLPDMNLNQSVHYPNVLPLQSCLGRVPLSRSNYLMNPKGAKKWKEQQKSEQRLMRQTQGKGR